MSDVLVIGLDTDSKGFHWASNKPLWDGTGDQPNPTYVGYSESSADTEIRRSISFRMARRFFKDALKEAEIVHVFCEEPLALQNGKTTRILGLAAGAIWSAFAAEVTSHDAYWHWVDVSSWKKDVVGKGNASKDDIAAFCQNNPAWKAFSFSRIWPEDEENAMLYSDIFEINKNLYDAWCIKTYGVRAVASS
jgi:Holliday junction resolvasome RuvABC endonuclease subunit